MTASSQPERARTERDAPKPARVIKRYANRKLYDTHDSRYVTLLQIAEFVRGGEEVSIIDNTTKEDLTNVTLAQIVYEEERKTGEEARKTSPTVSTLRGLIQHSGERLMTSLREGPVGKLMARREGDAVAPEPEPAVPEQPPAGAASAKGDRRLLMSPKEAFDELQRLADDRIRSVLGVAISHVRDLQSEVKRLQARIDELENKLIAAQRRRDSDAKDEDPSATPSTDPSAK